MKNFQIRTINTNQLIYEGKFVNFRSCLEGAIANKTDLTDAKLCNRNLSNAALDDGMFKGADFSGCNLSGANLSEANMRGAILKNTDLYNCCFAYADLTGADFTGAGFGATDITGADLTNVVFDTLSCFSLDFTKARSVAGCRFINPDGAVMDFSAPPVVVRGWREDLAIITDSCIKIGHRIYNRPQAAGYLKRMVLR
jgi:hypothetical protein